MNDSRPALHRSRLSGNLRAHVRWRTLEAHRRELVDFLRMRCGDATLADDLSQETFLRALHSGAPVERLDRPACWLRQVARNVSRDHHRREFVRPASQLEDGLEELLESTEPVPGAPGADMLLDVAGVVQDRSRLVLVLFRVWRDLPLRDRQVLRAHYFGGETVPQVARRFGARAETVRVWLYRARQRLRTRLERFVTGERQATYGAAAAMDPLPGLCAEPPAPEWRG